jgi:mannose-6-phosphate isomerase
MFEPWLRPQIWGGRNLATTLGKHLPSEGTFGESWEISGHPQHVSRVAKGPLAGTSLTDLIASDGKSLFGKDTPPETPFPLLIKFLDCQELLSIQVHPNDELAPKLGNDKFGKTEAWVVMDVAPGGRIYAGLKPGMNRTEMERHIAEGTTDQCLHSFVPRPGDCIFLQAGTVHTVGGGVLIAEVQQNSDATFRLFDWNRLGTDGKPRQLHIRESLESIDWSAGPVSPVKGNALSSLPEGVTGETLVQCSCFSMQRFQLSNQTLPVSLNQMTIWMILEGSILLTTSQGFSGNLCKGETVLLPANCGEAVFTGLKEKTILLRIES